MFAFPPFLFFKYLPRLLCPSLLFGALDDDQGERSRRLEEKEEMDEASVSGGKEWPFFFFPFFPLFLFHGFAASLSDSVLAYLAMASCQKSSGKDRGW